MVQMAGVKEITSLYWMSFLHAQINQRLEGKKLDRTKHELIPFEKQGRQNGLAV